MKRLLFATLFVAACSTTGLDSGAKSSGTSSKSGDGGSTSKTSSDDAGSGSAPGGLVDLGGVQDAAPTPVTGSFACGTQTCTPSQACYEDCTAAPTCVDVANDGPDLCDEAFGPMGTCTTGGSCNPNTRVIVCNCPQ